MIDKKSYNEHHNQYSQDIALEREMGCHEKYDSNEFEFIYQGDIPHGKILDDQPLPFEDQFPQSNFQSRENL